MNLEENLKEKKMKNNLIKVLVQYTIGLPGYSAPLTKEKGGEIYLSAEKVKAGIEGLSRYSLPEQVLNALKIQKNISTPTVAEINSLKVEVSSGTLDYLLEDIIPLKSIDRRYALELILKNGLEHVPGAMALAYQKRTCKPTEDCVADIAQATTYTEKDILSSLSEIEPG